MGLSATSDELCRGGGSRGRRRMGMDQPKEGAEGEKGRRSWRIAAGRQRRVSV